MENILDYNGNKGFRLLSMYERLNKGGLLMKAELARQFNVSVKTIQRDIDDLRAYLEEMHTGEQEAAIKYSKSRNGYYLVRFEREWLTNREVLAISKILLESRAFCREELELLIDKLLAQMNAGDRSRTEEIIQSERFYYVPPRHNKKLLETMWELSQYIIRSEIIEIDYTRKDAVTKQHKVKPVAIMFSEYYFYLIVFMADNSKDYPTVFRIDRIRCFRTTGTKFHIPYKDKFNDGEFRKRVQFMFSGELRKIFFEYSGPSIESVLDRLPTADILKEENGTYSICVEVYGNGIDMWLRSQGDYVKILKS